tara:strand:- start:281 stop:1609 length:1329 start_codon:yes stop_codon:yes gene_type:complete
LKILNLFNFLLDKNFSTTILNNISKLIRGPVTAFFIILYLNPEEQGYWYAFQSLLVFISLGELGISKIVTLKISEILINIKNTKKKSIFYSNFRELSSFIFINYILYFVIALFTFSIILFITNFIYPEWPQDIKDTFLLCLLFSSLSLFTTLQGAIFYGLDLVYWRNIQEFIFGVVFSLSIIIFFYFGFKIYSLVYSILIANILCQVIFIRYYFRWVKKMFKYISLKLGKDLLIGLKSLQFKYAVVTLMSLYITNSIVPFVIKYFDPVLAGQVGFSYFVLTSLVLMSWTFFYIKYPQILQLISENKLSEVYFISKKTLIQINLSILILILIFFFSIDLINEYVIEIKSRMLPLNFMILISISQLVLLNIGFFASLVRGFQVEPYWKLSLIQIFTTTGIYFLAVISNSLYNLFLIDMLLHLIFLFPLSIFLGKKQLYKIYASR